MTSRATLPTAATGGGSGARAQRADPSRLDPDEDDAGVVTTATRPARHETAHATWGIAAVAATVVFFVGAVLWSVLSGAIHRAYSDDWGYLRIAQRFLDDGHLEGVGWNDTSLLGQLLASKLLSPITGSSVAGLRVLSILAAAGSLVLTAVLARRSRARALWPIAPLTLVVMLGFGSTVSTYMTEQPALLAQLACVVLGVVAWQRWATNGRLPLATLVAVALIGTWGGSIRQAAIAAPLAVLAALFTHPNAKARERRVIVAVGLAVLLAVAVLMLTTPLEGPTMAIVRGSITGQVARLYQAATTLAVFLTPVGILTGWFGRTIGVMRRWSRSGRGRVGLALIALTVTAGGMLLDRRDGSLLVGNSLQEAGGYQGTDVAFPHLFDHFSWGVVQVLAAVTLFVATVGVVDALQRLWAAARRRDRHELVDLVSRTTALTRITLIWTIVGTLGVLAVNLAYRAIYDRYLIPVVIGLTILALDNRVERAPNRRRLTLTAIVFVPIALLGVISAVDSQDLLELRWHGGDRLVELGYAPANVDAGFDWVGYHYRGVARPDIIVDELTVYPPATYDAYFPDFVRCAIVSGESTAPPGYVLLDRVQHHRLFGLRTTTAYLYGSSADGLASCPPLAGR